MRKMWFEKSFLAAACLTAWPVLADDSTAELSAGGLVFTQSADIRMASEDLTISPLAVHVRYEFVNDSGHDIDAIVAFPLPSVDLEAFVETPIGRVTDDPVNFVGFRATSDGKPIAAQLQLRAMHNGKDVTAQVVAAGLPVMIYSETFDKKLDALTPAQRKQLQDAGLLVVDGDWLQPKWTVETSYYWHQLFPAGKTVVIEHDYHPVTGQSFFDKYNFAGGDGDYYRQTFCIDEPTRSQIAHELAARKPEAGNESYMFNAYDTGFVLKTAGNWHGPIGRFHLRLDKLKPENILSLCWSGPLKKTGPTTFESELHDFAPRQDLRILVLE